VIARALLVGLLQAAASEPAADGPEDAEGFPVLRKDLTPIIRSVVREHLAFCRRERYPLTPDERSWCLVTSGARGSAECPGFARACGSGQTASTASRGESRTLSLPEAPFFLRVLLWSLLAVAALVALYRLIRHVLAVRESMVPAGAKEARLARKGEAATPAAETDVERLLARARIAAARKDLRAAVDDVYAALLRRLEGAGLIRVEAHRTNGDHLREVSRKLPAMREPMQAVVVEVERFQFAGVEPTEAGYRTLHDRVAGMISGRLAAWWVAILGAGLATVLVGCHLERGTQGGAPSGRAAVLALLEEYGFDARERLASLTDLDQRVDQVVLLPHAEIEDAHWNDLALWAAIGGRLLIAGGDRVTPWWVPGEIRRDPSEGSTRLAVEGSRAARLADVHAFVPPGRQVRRPAAGDAATQGDPGPERAEAILSRGRSTYAVEQRHGAGQIVVFADDGLFTNASLLVADNARLLTEILREGGPTVEFIGAFTGSVSPNPMASVQRSRLAPAMLQLALVIVIFLLCKGAHFGKPRDPTTNRRRAFAEHVRAVGSKYARGRASRHALEVYGAYALERMRARLHLAEGGGLSSLAEAVAARTGRPLGEVMRLLLECRPEDSDPPGTKEDLVQLRQVSMLLTGIGGSRERN